MESVLPAMIEGGQPFVPLREAGQDDGPVATVPDEEGRGRGPRGERVPRRRGEAKDDCADAQQCGFLQVARGGAFTRMHCCA